MNGGETVSPGKRPGRAPEGPIPIASAGAVGRTGAGAFPVTDPGAGP
jgi:hypothetical protein